MFLKIDIYIIPQQISIFISSVISKSSASSSSVAILKPDDCNSSLQSFRLCDAGCLIVLLVIILTSACLRCHQMRSLFSHGHLQFRDYFIVHIPHLNHFVKLHVCLVQLFNILFMVVFNCFKLLHKINILIFQKMELWHDCHLQTPPTLQSSIQITLHLFNVLLCTFKSG
jgi:hypothetical protein